MGDSDANDKPDAAAAPQPGHSAAPNALSRRHFFGTLGLSTAVAAASDVRLPSLLLPQGSNPDWNAAARLAQQAFGIAVNEWIERARIQGGQVSGAMAILAPGTLVSDVNIQARMLQILAGWRVPSELATPIANVLAAAWIEWAAGFQIRIPGAYPAFTAVPGPSAPPTRAAISPPLALGSSTGEMSLTAPALANRLDTALRGATPQDPRASPDEAMQALANWVQDSFTQWKRAVSLTGLMGRGPVPTFAPPYVPVGPVISGESFSSGALFAGPRFGIGVP
jgi:hypothetical protein